MLAGLVNDQGWERPLAEARVFSDWAGLVGGDVAAHAHPQQLHDGELRVAAESTAWATQLRLLAGNLVARLTAELGPGVVTRLVVTGPVAPELATRRPHRPRRARPPRHLRLSAAPRGADGRGSPHRSSVAHGVPA